MIQPIATRPPCVPPEILCIIAFLSAMVAHLGADGLLFVSVGIVLSIFQCIATSLLLRAVP